MFSHKVVSLCNPMDCSTQDFPILYHLQEFAQTHVHWVSNAIQPSHSLLPPSPPTISFPRIRVFSNELPLHIRWPKYWSFSLIISPSNEYSGLISFRIDWFDLPVVQGTLRSLSNTMVQKHQFFGTQPSLWSNSHISTWLLEKSQLWYLDLSRQNDVSSFSCAVYVSHSFSSKEQASFNFTAAVTICSDFGAQENNFFPIYLPWTDGTGCHGVNFLNVEF